MNTTPTVPFRRLRTLALLGGLCLGVASPVALAQADGESPRAERRGPRGEEGARPHRGRHHHHAGFLRALDLTPEQKAELRALHLEMRNELAAIREAYPPGSEEARAARRSLRDGSRAAMLELLTPEQREELSQLRAARHEERTRGSE